jgi:lysozyme
MTLHPRLSPSGLELVKRFEGLRRKAGRLDGGGWTIGYGHTVSAREGAEVTAEEAEALLLYDLDKVARAIDALTSSGLNANQFAALTAFAFNIGLENFKTSAVLRRVNEGAYLQAAAAIEMWRRADVRGDSLVVDALVRRRAAEKALFLTPEGGFRPVPTPVVRAAYDASGSDLSDAVELSVPLDGEAARAERHEAPGAATTAAAASVAAWLQELIPDAPAHAGIDALAEAEPSPAHEPEPELEPEPEPEPEPPPPLVLEPPPLFEPEPVFDAAPAPPASEEPEPPPSLFQPTADNRFIGEETYPETSDDPFGRRAFAYGVEPAAAYASPSAPPPSLHAPVVLLVGAAGAVMFVGALVAMVYGKATLANLAIGLLGVVCMAPAGLKLLLKLFGERGLDQEA